MALDEYRDQLKIVQDEIVELDMKTFDLKGKKIKDLGNGLRNHDAELAHVSRVLANKKDKERNLIALIGFAAAAAQKNEIDYDRNPFYSTKLARFGLITPIEQLNTYTAFAAGGFGIAYSSIHFYRAHHLSKLSMCTSESQQWIYHGARASVTPEQISRANYWMTNFKVKGMIGLCAPVLLVAFVASKYNKRKDFEYVMDNCVSQLSFQN